MRRIGFGLAAVSLLILAFAAIAANAQGASGGEMNMNVMLCDTPEHAIAYAVAINKGAADDEAKDIVGRAAGIEVCDKFMGLASAGEEKTLSEKGVTYRVTAFKFTGVGKMRWSAIPQN